MLTHAFTIAALVLSASPSEVQVRTLDGMNIRGQLVSLTRDGLETTVDGQRTVFKAQQLHTLGIHGTAATSRWKMQIALLDGSMLHGVSYFVMDDTATVRFTDGSQQSFPVRHVRYALLRNSGSDLQREWQNYLLDKSATDRLIVRRLLPNKSDPTERATVSLDAMEGIVGNVADDGVRFELEGDAIKVKREKTEGIIYLRRPSTLAQQACCYAVDIDGSRWAVKTLASTEHGLTIMTPTAIELTLPWSQLRSLDYFSANAVYLSPDLWDSSKRTSFIEIAPANDTTFRPLFDKTPEGSIQCGGKDYARGIWLPAQSSLTFNVPEKFSRLSLQVGFDDRIGNSDGALLVIEADGKKLCEQIITRSPQLLPLSFELQKARRVRIKVDYAGESHLGDTLILSEAMFTQ